MVKQIKIYRSIKRERERERKREREREREFNLRLINYSHTKEYKQYH